MRSEYRIREKGSRADSLLRKENKRECAQRGREISIVWWVRPDITETIEPEQVLWGWERAGLGEREESAERPEGAQGAALGEPRKEGAPEILDGLTPWCNSPISKFPSKWPKNDFSDNNGKCEMKVKVRKDAVCELFVGRRISVSWRLGRTKLEEPTHPQFSVCGGEIVHESGMVPQRICTTS